MRTINEVHILVGLPASGKTHFALSNTLKQSYNSHNLRIDFDAIAQDKRVKYKDLPEREEEIVRMIRSKGIGDNIYLDGMFCTQDIINRTVALVFKAFIDTNPNKNYTHIKKIIIDYWEPDINICLWNDKDRRDISSAETIKHCKIEIPNAKKLSEYILSQYPVQAKNTVFSFTKHYPCKKPNWVSFFQKNLSPFVSTEYCNTLDSGRWSLGGKCWGWDGKESPVDSEEPLDFEELDSFLEEIAPNITFLQYKKLKKQCVKCVTVDNSDYYSRTIDAYWSCDLKELYDFFVDNNIIKEE